MLKPTRQIWKANALLWKKLIKPRTKSTPHLKCAAVFILYSETYLNKKNRIALKRKANECSFLCSEHKQNQSLSMNRKRKKDDQFDHMTITDDKNKYLMLVFWFIACLYAFLELNPGGTGFRYHRYINTTEWHPWSTY